MLFKMFNLDQDFECVRDKKENKILTNKLFYIVDILYFDFNIYCCLMLDKKKIYIYIKTKEKNILRNEYIFFIKNISVYRNK